ncbi:hypothetical protein IAQ61_003230 [Plenodomus lingam]|uniref:uncharacterized protein n=1 Tax=Leptosphaeria maculans TaxID=5022 RepID=UPI00332A53DB|nr:hypothetical protein IAQ61_003230 [Plenodomus lingam]
MAAPLVTDKVVVGAGTRYVRRDLWLCVGEEAVLQEVSDEEFEGGWWRFVMDVVYVVLGRSVGRIIGGGGGVVSL